MHWHRLIAPDFFLGRLLSMIRALFDVTVLLLREPSKRSLRITALAFRLKPRFTMVTTRNLVALYNLIQELDQCSLPGAIVECGVWNGGSAAMMAAASADRAYPAGRRAMWLFDSFEGLPPPSNKDTLAEQSDYFQGWCKGEIENVKRAFNELGLSLDRVEIVRGWFDQTLPFASVPGIALLHIDADWYDSVKLVLDTFYDRVAPGGYVMLDGYGYWQGCNRAVADFFQERGLRDVHMTQTARGGAYFQKPAVS
jgi:O-methyltransferase